MRVKIRETGEIVELGIIDPKSGLNFVSDFIGNTGAMNDGQFVQDGELCHAEQSTVEWWLRVLSEHEALDDRIYSLTAEHGVDAVYAAIGTAGNCDLEDAPAAINQALNVLVAD